VADPTVVIDVDKPFDNNLLRTAIVLEMDTLEVGLGAYRKNVASGNYIIFENPYYTTYGLDSIAFGQASLYCSDDAESWTYIRNSAGAIPSEHRSKRYWKVVASAGQYYFLESMTSRSY
jgi:hypothetical protein